MMRKTTTWIAQHRGPDSCHLCGKQRTSLVDLVSARARLTLLRLCVECMDHLLAVGVGVRPGDYIPVMLPRSR